MIYTGSRRIAGAAHNRPALHKGLFSVSIALISNSRKWLSGNNDTEQAGICADDALLLLLTVITTPYGRW